jgi:hypothetical protein
VVRGYITVGAMMAASGVVCLFLKETKGEALLDSIVAPPSNKPKVKDKVTENLMDKVKVTENGKVTDRDLEMDVVKVGDKIGKDNIVNATTDVKLAVVEESDNVMDGNMNKI